MGNRFTSRIPHREGFYAMQKPLLPLAIVLQEGTLVTTEDCQGHPNPPKVISRDFHVGGARLYTAAQHKALTFYKAFKLQPLKRTTVCLSAHFLRKR